MPKFLKDFKHYKLATSILVLVLILAGTGALFYYQTRVTETCEKKLQSYSENHLCISTTKGLMVFELYKDAGPKAVERMTKLSNEDKFYDGLEFYRVVEGFVAQAGIQDTATRLTEYGIDTSTSEGQTLKNKIEKLGTDTFAVETDFDDLGLSEETKKELVEGGYTSDSVIKARKFKYGSLSFANNGATGNSSEFYIITNKNENDENVAALNGKFTNFGQIVEGEDVLERINSAKPDLNYPLEFANGQDKPAERIGILEMRVK